METPKEVMNERNGKGDEKPWVVCVVNDVSAQWQFSEGGAPRKSAEERQQQRERQQDRMQCSEVWIGFSK